MAKRVIVSAHDNMDSRDYEGDYDATVSPNGELLIIENSPDVGNSNDGQPVKEIRAIYNGDSWYKVEVE